MLSIILLFILNRYKKTSLPGNTCTIDELLLKCKSGDLILYQDRSKAFWHLLYDQSQRLILGHAYTHCGIILKQEREAYIIESIPRDHPQIIHRDLFSGTYNVTGVKTIPLSVACYSYPGGIVWYPLNKEVNCTLLQNIGHLLSTTSYPAISAMIPNVFLGVLKYAKIREFKNKFICNEKQQSDFFCSELVTFIFRSLGVFKLDGLQCNYWLPNDFTNKDLPFDNTYSFLQSSRVLIEH